VRPARSIRSWPNASHWRLSRCEEEKRREKKRREEKRREEKISTVLFSLAQLKKRFGEGLKLTINLSTRSASAEQAAASKQQVREYALLIQIPLLITALASCQDIYRR